MHNIRVKRDEVNKLKRHILSLAKIAQLIRDLETKDKIERAVALLIQVVITAKFKSNQKDFFEGD